MILCKDTRKDEISIGRDQKYRVDRSEGSGKKKKTTRATSLYRESFQLRGKCAWTQNGRDGWKSSKSAYPGEASDAWERATDAGAGRGWSSSIKNRSDGIVVRPEG